MQANPWHHNYSSFIWPIESGKYGKEGKKTTKIGISWEWK